MEIYPLRSRLVKHGDSILEAIVAALRRERVNPKNGDIIAVSSKVVSLAEGRLSDLSKIHPSARAQKLARKYSMEPQFVQLVIDDADRHYSGVKGAILTVKDGDAVANAGADQKNSPNKHVIVWPRNLDASCRRLRSQLERRYGKKIGVVIVDSTVTPLRLGTIGLALASAGFKPVENLRGRPDLHGRKLRITRHAVADGLASATHLVMGEANEKIPFVLVRNSPVKVDGRNRSREEMLLPIGDCLYMSNVHG